MKDRGSGRGPSVVLVVLAWALVSCRNAAERPTGSGVLVDTIGDTVSVFTRGAGVWGGRATLEPTLSIGDLDGPPEHLFSAVWSLAVDAAGTAYVLDLRAAEVRAFDRDGRYVRTYGRRGEGPGELRSPTEVAVLSDGRVLVRDDLNRRVQVYRPDGAPDTAWTLLHPVGGTWPLLTDDQDRVLVVTADQAKPIGSHEPIVIHVSATGEVLDTMALPTSGIETPVLEANLGTRAASGYVPYAPVPQWALHPSGRILLARGDRYALDLIAGDGSVFRIGRAYEPVPVTDEERATAREHTIAGMHRTDPRLEWDGPPIPDMKPPFSGVYVGRRGRIWTLLYTPTHHEPNPDHDPADPMSWPTIPVGERILDVFEADGTYLGEVEAPLGFNTRTVRFDGDDVWAVTTDALGVQRVVRYALRPP